MRTDFQIIPHKSRLAACRNKARQFRGGTMQEIAHGASRNMNIFIYFSLEAGRYFVVVFIQFSSKIIFTSERVRATRLLIIFVAGGATLRRAR